MRRDRRTKSPYLPYGRRSRTARSTARRKPRETIPGPTGPQSDPQPPIGRTRMSHQYEVLIQWSDEDRAFVARVPELPGCMAHGSTKATAQENIEQAIAFWLETAREYGDPVPEPQRVSDCPGKSGALYPKASARRPATCGCLRSPLHRARRRTRRGPHTCPYGVGPLLPSTCRPAGASLAIIIHDQRIEPELDRQLHMGHRR